MEQYNRIVKNFILNNTGYSKFVEDVQVLVSPDEAVFQRFVQDFEKLFTKLLTISTSSDNIEARNAVHGIHETIKQVIVKNPTIRNEKWWNEMSIKYLAPVFQEAVIKQIREDDSTWLKSWSLMANLMLKSNQLKGCSVNVLLKIVEAAFRLSKTKPVLADQAFICWIELIEIISCNNNCAQINKIGGLFVKPLATNVPPKTYALKLKAWDTLIKKIATPYDDHVVDIVVAFLKTAFTKNNYSLAHHMPNECLSLLQEILNFKSIDKYSINLISTLSHCAQFDVNPVQFSSFVVEIITYCKTLKGEEYINHLKELVQQTVLSSKTLKQFPNVSIITKIGFMMDNENFLETMNDYKTRNEVIMPFIKLIIEIKDIHTMNNKNKQDILGIWEFLFSSFVRLSTNEITQDEMDVLFALIVFPISSNLWSSAAAKPWISSCEALRKKDMFTKQGEKLINYMMDSLKQTKITTVVVLEVLKIISNVEVTLLANCVPILELVCEKLPKDFNQIMSVIHLTELTIGIAPKSTLYTLLNLKLTNATKNFDHLQQHKIKSSLLKLRKKLTSLASPNDELKTSPESKLNGSFSLRSNFLYRMARAEEKKKDSVSSISNIFNTDDKNEEKTEKENFEDRENQKEIQEKDEKPLDEKENLPKSPLLVKSNQIHIVRNDIAKSPKSPGLNKARKSPAAKLITPKKTTPSKCTYFENDNASDYVVVVPKQTTTVLTEHQKEVMSKRRADIPALYQDLSQDTQTISLLEDTKSNENKTSGVAQDKEIPKSDSHNLITPDRTEFLKPNSSAKKLDFYDQPVSSHNTRSSGRNLAKSNKGKKDKIDVELEEKIAKRRSDPGNRTVSNVLPKKPNGETDPVPKRKGRKRKEPLEDNNTPVKRTNIDASADTDSSVGSDITGNRLSLQKRLQIEIENFTKKRGRRKGYIVETDTSESDCVDQSDLPKISNGETTPVSKRKGRKRKENLGDNKEGTPVNKIKSETEKCGESSMKENQETPKRHELETIETKCKKCEQSIKSENNVKLCISCEESEDKEEPIKTSPKFKQNESTKTENFLISFSPAKVTISVKKYYNKNKASPKFQTEESIQNQVKEIKLDVKDSKNENSDSKNVQNQSVVDTPKSDELILKELLISETAKFETSEKQDNKSPEKQTESQIEEPLQNQVEEDKMEVENSENEISDSENYHKRKRGDLESPVSDSKRPKLEIEQTPVSMYKRTHRQTRRKRMLQSKSKCTINFTPNNLEQWLYKLNKDVVKKDLIEEPEKNENLETRKENQNPEETVIEENTETPIIVEESDNTELGVSLLSSFVESDEATKLLEIPKKPSSPPTVLNSPVTSRAGRIMLLTKENGLLTPTKRRNIVPQKYGENWPKGPTEEWIAHNPDMGKSPARSSLKDTTQIKDFKTPEENAQPKRVSFLDPPVSLGLIYNDNTGALHFVDTPRGGLKRVWAKENTNTIDNTTPEESIIIDEKVQEKIIKMSNEQETSFTKTDEYDLKSLPNIKDCDKPVTEVLFEMDNYESLESEFMKLGVNRVGEMSFFTAKTIEQLSIKPPKQQTLYLAVKAFLEKEEKAKNESNKETKEKVKNQSNKVEEKAENESNKQVETNQPTLINIASYQGVITPQQLLQLAEHNKSFLESLHDIMSMEFLTKVVLSKMTK